MYSHNHKKISFAIAGINFLLNSKEPQHLNWIRDAYQPFLNSDFNKKDIYIIVKTIKSTAKISRPSFKNKQSFLKFNIGRNLIAHGDLSCGEVFVEVKKGFGLGGFLRALIAAAVIEKNGFLLHASGVVDGNNGYIFCGPSESGKTTIARLAGKRRIFSDETVAIRRNLDKWYAYATPFFGELGRQETNIKAPVKYLFFIKKDNNFQHHRLFPKEIARKILPNIILIDNHPKITDRLFNTVLQAIENIPSYDFYFKKDDSIWRYIHGIAQ